MEPAMENQTSPEHTPTIPDLRLRIDEVDLQILDLVNQRASLALQIGHLKSAQSGENEPPRPIYVPEREKAVFMRLAERNKGPLDNDAVRNIYREVISACRALEKPLRVAYFGPPATYTHMAAMRKFGGSTRFLPRRVIAEVIHAVETGEEVGIEVLVQRRRSEGEFSVNEPAAWRSTVHRGVLARLSARPRSVYEGKSGNGP
jgi:chorismate mutase-like protein